MQSKFPITEWFHLTNIFKMRAHRKLEIKEKYSSNFLWARILFWYSLHVSPYLYCTLQKGTDQMQAYHLVRTRPKFNKLSLGFTTREQFGECVFFSNSKIQPNKEFHKIAGER